MNRGLFYADVRKERQASESHGIFLSLPHCYFSAIPPLSRSYPSLIPLLSRSYLSLPSYVKLIVQKKVSICQKHRNGNRNICYLCGLIKTRKMIDEHFLLPLVHREDAQTTLFQADFLNLVDFIQQVHPLPDVDARKFEVLSHTAQAAYEGMGKLETLPDFWTKVNQWLAQLRDAHTFFMPDFKEAYSYTIRYFNGSFYFYALPDTCPNDTGVVITAINGQAMKEVADRCYTLLPSENSAKACIFGSFCLSQKSFLHALGIDTRGGLHFSLSNGNEVEMPIGMLASRAIRQRLVKRMTHPITGQQEAPYTCRLINNVCYFQFNAMYDRFTYLQSCRLRGIEADEAVVQALPLFTDFLRELGTVLKRQRIKTLVIDLRYNGGGNSLLGDQLLQFLGINLDDIHSYQTHIRRSSFLITHYPHLFSTRTDNHTETAWMKDIPPFSGQVYFLQGQNTFSSANYLLTTIKDNALFPILGTPTSQKPTCFGDVLPVCIPLTGIRGFVSHSYFIRPRKEDKADTLTPDIFIPYSLEEYLHGQDPCWNWIEMHR